MRSVWLIFANEVRRRLRDRTALVVAFIAPLSISAVLGFAFHGGGEVRVAVSGAAGQSHAAVALVRSVVGAGTRLVPASDSGAVRRLVVEGKVDLGVVVPSGDGAPGVVVRRDQPLGAPVANSLLSALASAGHPRTATVSVVDLTVNGSQGAVGYFGPSMAVVFLFFVASVGARGLLSERESGTLVRLRSAPVTATQVVAAKVVAMFALSITSILVLWAITVHAFAASWGAPLPVLVICLASALAMTGIGAVVTVLSRTTQQAMAVSGIVGFALGLLGGNFFPPGSLPPFMVTASRITPNGWALQAFGTLSLDHGGLSDVATAAVVLAVMAAVFGLGAWLMVRRTVLS